VPRGVHAESLSRAGCPGPVGSACLDPRAVRYRPSGGRDGLSIEVEAQITGNVWKIETTVGAQVEEDDVLLIIESMKMEIPVEAPEDGKVLEIKVAEGQAIEEGDVLVVLEA
jgi:acetyl-CoA carboxylase biotin carboxyl carrier protein